MAKRKTPKAEKIVDLKPDMLLEGVVTNVTNFGAFVDVGVHQDGLVHISAMSERFIKDPRDLVKAGDLVKVKVMAVDLERKRIGLSMRLSDSAEQQPDNKRQRRTKPVQDRNRPGRKKEVEKSQGVMAAALSGAIKRKDRA